MRRLLLAATLLLLTASARADEVVLLNGDRLRGKVLRMTAGKLVLKTDYSARPLEIDRSKVKSVTTDAPVELHLAGGEVLKARLRTDGQGGLEAGPAAGRAEVAVDWAQVRAINPPKSLWHGSVTVAGADQGGNTDRGSFSLAAGATRRTERDRMSLRFLHNYAEEEGRMTARSVFGAGKYDWFFTEKLYGYANVELLSDTFRDLELRTAVGGGLGWQVREAEDFSLALEAGAAYVNENLRLGQDRGWVSARLAGSLKWRFFGKVTFTDELAGMPSFESDQYQLRNEAGLSTPLGAGWSLKLANVFEYDNQPSAGVKKTDRTWLFGLQYKF